MAESSEQVLDYLTELSDEQAQRIGQRARQRVLDAHTPARRAAQLEDYLEQALSEHQDARAADAKR